MRLTYLYRQYQANALTEEEREEWEAALMDVSNDKTIQDLIDAEWQLAAEEAQQFKPDSEDTYQYIVGHDQQQRQPRRKLTRWVRYAAAVALLAGGGYLLWGERTAPRSESRPSIQVVENIAPGGNKAMLTLTDGQVLGLSSEQSGIVMGDQITYEDGKVVAELNNGNTDYANFKLVTPKGGTYQVTLSDGTKVWLNADSKLQYPQQFNHERRVFLSGEGYFEVTKDPVRSFVVSTPEQEVAVLGTRFNMTAYPGEESAKTTLVEGKVRVANPKSGIMSVLNPGQQGVANGNDLLVKEVNTSQFTAWKDGFFSFDKTPFSEVLEQLARWYDIEILYNKIPAQTFSGRMKRDAQLLSVLDFLEGSGINFQLDGRRLIID